MRRTTGALMILSLFLGALVLVAAPARCQSMAAVPALSGLPNHKALEARYQGNDAVVLFDSLVVTLDDGNHITRRRHRAVMLFTDNAINRYGDPRILFNAAAQELSIIAARVYMRDGTIADTQKNGFNQTTPFALDHAPDYADWQETVVTHVRIEKGCVAELHYVIRDLTPSPWLSGVEIFSTEDPVQSRVLMVAPGRGRDLTTSSQNSAPAGAPSGGVWSWAVRDIAGRTPFDGGVWEGDYFPTVCYGTAARWQDVLAVIGADLAAKSSALPAVEARVRDAMKDLTTDEDKVLAIHRLAIGAASDIHAPFTLFSAPARAAARIYDTGYASPLDRAVLLAAMLRTAGYEPAFVLVSSGRAVIGEVPAPELFSRVAVAVTVKDAGELLLDPTAAFEHDLSFVLAGKTLAYFSPEPRLSALATRNVNDSRSELAVVLKPGKDGGLEGKGTAVLKGAFSPYYVVRKDGNGFEDFLKTRVSGLFVGAELVTWNPRSLERDRAEIEFAFTVPLPDAKKGERLYLAAPKTLEAALSGIERVHLERSDCADAVRFEPCVLEMSCTIDLPEGWKLIATRFDANEKNEIGTALVNFQPQSDGTYLFRKQLVLNRDVVPPASYGEFRSLLLAFGEDRIVLEKE
jgi:hypothetical protein